MTVGYARIRGRASGRRMDGSYDANKSRTFPSTLSNPSCGVTHRRGYGAESCTIQWGK
jgi:hypothetical protein